MWIAGTVVLADGRRARLILSGDRSDNRLASRLHPFCPVPHASLATAAPRRPARELPLYLLYGRLSYGHRTGGCG
ncbi:hypothetical protein EDD30_3521 [Couchioplanes caeruleus]|uniref:Uncharacterized protein n=1 Tax=Couchioplanes caeruleus TaxID=56438 RepID=A0A3N1GK41_9ACTN|nr:hypothetical protein EDD30_3521 [Couchioplanes caeruleus]